MLNFDFHNPTHIAFGQGRMEAIVSDGLPQGSYVFQHTLSNNSRPDCVIFMPNGAPNLVIDAKFPLESWQRLQGAQNEQEQHVARLGFRQDMQVHVRAISEKYLIAGETQDTAFMFVPSESIFADLHEHFADVVQAAHREPADRGRLREAGRVRGEDRGPVDEADQEVPGLVEGLGGRLVAQAAAGVDRHAQRVGDELGSHVLVERVADQAPRSEIDHRRHEQPALTGRDVGDVLHPGPVRCAGIEAAAEHVHRAGAGLAGARGL